MQVGHFESDWIRVSYMTMATRNRDATKLQRPTHFFDAVLDETVGSACSWRFTSSGRPMSKVERERLSDD